VNVEQLLLLNLGIQRWRQSSGTFLSASAFSAEKSMLLPDRRREGAAPAAPLGGTEEGFFTRAVPAPALPPPLWPMLFP
jgi:hypothetical protein